MMSSTTLRPLVPAAAASHLTTGAPRAAGRRSAAVVARAVRNYDSIPKREPFSSSRSILDEFLRQEKPLVQRTKDQITGAMLRCRSTLAVSLRCSMIYFF
jgi:hypothetical protein